MTSLPKLYDDVTMESAACCRFNKIIVTFPSAVATKAAAQWPFEAQVEPQKSDDVSS